MSETFVSKAVDENGDGSIGSFQKNIYALWKFLHYVGTSLHKMARSELLPSSCLSVCLSAWNSTTNERIFIKFDICGIFRKSVQKIQASLQSDLNNGHFT